MDTCKLPLVQCSRGFYFILFYFIFVGGQICGVIFLPKNFHTKIIVITLTIGIENSQFFLNFCQKKNKVFQKEKTLVPRHYHKEQIKEPQGTLYVKCRPLLSSPLLSSQMNQSCLLRKQNSKGRVRSLLNKTLLRMRSLPHSGANEVHNPNSQNSPV
jgi:hypothetical protein